MRFLYRAAVAAATLFGSAAGAQQLTPQHFATLPAMEAPAISPDGQSLAFITYTPAGSAILVSNLSTMEVTKIVEATDVKPRSVAWASDDALLVAAGETVRMAGVVGQFESTRPFGINLSGRLRAEQLLQEGRRLQREGGTGVSRIGGFQFIQGAQLVGFERDTGRVLMPKFNDDAERVLYAVDPKNDRQREIDEGSRDTVDWIVNAAGEPVFRADYSGRTNHFRILSRAERGWDVLVSETTEIPELDMYGLNAQGELVVGARPSDAGRYGLYALSTDTGELSRAIFVHDSLDVVSVSVDPYTNRVVGAGVSGEPPVWFEDDLVQQQTLLEEAFAGESPNIVSWSQDRTRFIVRTESGDRPPAYYLYDAQASTADIIATTYPQLDAFNLPERRPYSYAARDGVKIPGYLTRPIDASGATPLIVLPHGGPAARDVAGFDWIAHFLALRGYTVLQPNFRGSGGFGDAWRTAGFGEWGTGVMQHDVSDGVAAVVADGLADPDRVCIVGGSYGGYAALAGGVFTPELYRCVAAIAPVTDLVDMLTTERNRFGGFSPTVAYWRLAIGGGDPDNLNDRLRAVSPADHAEAMQAPVLLIHGEDDTVVPIAQSRSMERALRNAGKDVELVELDGEDHWLSLPVTRLQALQALDAFLAENLR